MKRTAESKLDPRDLEARTQAIGEELFASAKSAHEHLSAVNRWTGQVLSWCLTDPAVKGSVLRFIDVLPVLKSPREMARHLREYFPTSDLRLPAALRLGSGLANRGLVTHGALAAVMGRLVEQVARQFIAESRLQGASKVIETLASAGATCSLDVLGEQVLSEAEADQYAAHCQALLDEASAAYAKLSVPSCGPRVNLSVKPSALSPRFDPISPEDSIERAARRLLPLVTEAARRGGLITLDMEHYELRDLTLALARHIMETSPAIGIVVQAYLRDADASVEELLKWLAAHDRRLTVRLVKGAYWDYEVSQALQRHWPVPVYEDKGSTDLAFERLTRRLLSASPRVTTAIASHNVRSIAHAMAAAESLGMAKSDLEFQLLYGMGEAIQTAILERGYPVRVYTPIGELIPGMAYLVRRILENTSNESFLRQEFLQERSAIQLLQPPASTEPETPRMPSAAWTGEPVLDFSKAEPRDRMARAIQAVRGQLGRRYPLILGGDLVDAKEQCSVTNPAAPNEVVGQVARATRAQADRAVAAAAAAQPHWAAMPVAERVACLQRAADLMRERRYELAAWQTVEVGKPWREADADVVEAIDYLDYYSQQMLRLADGRPLIQVPGEKNLYRYLPRGVAVVIAPWNFPAAILTGMASAALVTGNAVILKPSEQSSVIAAHIAQILRAAKFPPGIVQCLPGAGEEVGDALVRHPGVHLILFTGSQAVGTSILAATAVPAPGQRFLKQVVAEMGGKNAIIVDSDADLDAAIAGTIRSAFGYAGQKCSAASRVIAHADVYDRFVSRLTAAVDRLAAGNPADPRTDLGPLIEASAQQRLGEAVAHARKIAKVAYEYPSSRLPASGYYVPPAIVTDVPPDDRLAQEELFGPLLCVFRANSFDEALALANDTRYALTGGVYSRSPSHVERAIHAFDVGNLYINRPITGAIVGRQPFGGHRLSGKGTKAGGPDYLLQLLIPKTITTDTTRHGMPLE